MPGIKSFRELRVYDRARQGSKSIYERSCLFPKEERYSLTDQLRRSSRAVNAMIAEAWARRRYKAVFINKLDEALGEAMETQAWLDHSLDAGLISTAEHQDLDNGWREVGGMLARMIDRADDFCKHPPDTNFRTLRR